VKQQHGDSAKFSFHLTSVTNESLELGIRNSVCAYIMQVNILMKYVQTTANMATMRNLRHYIRQI